MEVEEKFIHIRDVLKDFDNETDVEGNARFHSLVFITLSGEIHRIEKACRRALPQRVANVKTLRNCCDESTGNMCLFNFRLLIGFNGMKVKY